jgi:hypothetical protein
LKLVIIAIASIGILIGVIIYSDRPTAPPIPPITNPIHMGMPPVSIYNPDELVQLSWTVGKENLKLKNSDGVWSKISGASFIHQVDQWGAQRRGQVLSRLPLENGITVPNELGKIEFTISSSKEKITGIYDHQNFQFVSGPVKDKGFHLDTNKDLREIISEGLWGFYPHKIELCRYEKLKSVAFKDWSLERVQDWIVVDKDKKDKARTELVKPFLEKICHLDVDAFSTGEEPGAAPIVLKIESKSGTNEVKEFANTFSARGFPYFKSRGLAETLILTHPEDLRDPTSKEAQTAINKRASQQERLDAIRKLRGNKSPESIAALREIIFENTDIDLYRYEAVDTLTDIGTKESLKVLIDRLPQVGRSGFELRIARALAGAMGTFFRSDEKTPEETRRPEVDNLVQMALKKPPGK